MSTIRWIAAAELMKVFRGITIQIGWTANINTVKSAMPKSSIAHFLSARFWEVNRTDKFIISRLAHQIFDLAVDNETWTAVCFPQADGVTASDRRNLTLRAVNYMYQKVLRGHIYIWQSPVTRSFYSGPSQTIMPLVKILDYLNKVQWRYIIRYLQFQSCADALILQI